MRSMQKVLFVSGFFLAYCKEYADENLRAISALLLLVLVQAGFSQTEPRKFYRYEIVEASSSNLQVFAAPSINDFGDVAFSGRFTTGGGTVFLSRIGQSNVDLMPEFSGNPINFVGGRVKINDFRQVIQQTFISGTTPAQNFLRRINDVSDYTLVAAANGAGGFNDFNQIYASSISINNFGQPVYVTRIGNDTTILTTGIRPHFSLLQFPSTGDSLRPTISNYGDIVLRAGANQTDPIMIYSYDLAKSDVIAGIIDGFTSVGQSPAISKTNEVITFYGDLNQVGADALGTNPGPGIFASIEIDEDKGTRQIVRLAGRLIEDISAPGGNDDGWCDPGETCMPGELGFTTGGTPIVFSSFDQLDRIAVTHQEAGAKGIEDDIFVVSFQGTPNVASDNPNRPFSDQPGLWTVTTQIKNVGGVLRERPAVPVPVIQLGDTVDGRTVTAINVYDHLAGVRTPGSTAQSPGDHRLAFHLVTNNGNLIVRAERAGTPVIFIPGITGSRLAEVTGSGTPPERWPGLGPSIFTGSNLDRLLPSNNANIIATDVIRYLLPGELKPIYGPLLQTLGVSGGLREYLVDGIPGRRTTQGCDLQQRFNSPTLFVFAYDWRLSNIENAQKLKDYIGCIQKFHPGTKVDLVAHSMGGLLARRYIISNPQDHSVRKMISIGSPFLGAPEALQVIETGKPKSLEGILGKTALRASPPRVKNIAIESLAAHELLPSEAYFDLGGSPFAEETFDINGNGTFPEEYDYPQIFEFFNDRFPTAPYLNNELFHGFAGQDDWRGDTSGVDYFHIFGERRGADTIEQIVARPIAKKPLSVTRLDLRIRSKLGPGDKTVPRLSAERCEIANCPSGLNFNAPNATVIGFVSESSSQDEAYEHLGLVKATEILEEVLEILELPNQALVGGTLHQNTEAAMKMVILDKGVPTGAQTPPKVEMYYATIEGVDRLDITDNEGNTNTPLGDDGFELSVPGVGYHGGIYADEVNIGYHGLSLPADIGEYTIKFMTGTDSIDIEVLKGVGNSSPNLAIRYIDLDLPPNVECLLTFNPQGVPDLSYDSNGDGTYDTVVPAHVRVTGTAAQDVTAPLVSLEYSHRTGQGRLITINAADTESGVQTVYYRVGETGPFQIYTGTFFLHLPTAKVVEAFADDNVGNRSSPIRVVVPAWNTLP
ncbi:MAG TPA: alpha/beta fold hydrolase [Pyrinomonadaceae bacterium]|nr:alpha/beta fold hydrolase [Pyrinomonadaceae bacterium]